MTVTGTVTTLGSGTAAWLAGAGGLLSPAIARLRRCGAGGATGRGDDLMGVRLDSPRDGRRCTACGGPCELSATGGGLGVRRPVAAPAGGLGILRGVAPGAAPTAGPKGGFWPPRAPREHVSEVPPMPRVEQVAEPPTLGPEALPELQAEDVAGGKRSSNNDVAGSSAALWLCSIRRNSAKTTAASGSCRGCGLPLGSRLSGLRGVGHSGTTPRQLLQPTPRLPRPWRANLGLGSSRTVTSLTSASLPRGSPRPSNCRDSASLGGWTLTLRDTAT